MEIPDLPQKINQWKISVNAPISGKKETNLVLWNQ